MTGRQLTTLWLSVLVFLIFGFLLAMRAAHAHDRWSNGEAVPAWVKNACCGPSDVHHIPAEAIHLRADGYHIDDIGTVVPEKEALPSPDGTYWGFWAPVAEPNPQIYCFFAPLRGV
jgi:hypothetical protein